MNDLRVLEAITPSKIGGAEVFVANLCESLPALGAHVELFIPSGRPFVGYMADRGIPAVTWKTHGKLDLLTILRLASLIKRTNADIIHTHLSTASLLGALAAKLAGKPSVAHVHGLNTATCFTYSTLVIAVSNAVKQHLCAQGLDPNKIRVVHNGVDIQKFEPVNSADAKLKLGYDAKSPLFGVFGRLSSEKGQRVAIEAMFLLLKDYPTARLVLAGDGKDLDDLKTTAQALGITENIQFAGFANDIRCLMSACDAIIVPSLKEGFGLAAVEAMALERPVVASAIGGLNEIVLPNETGFLVAPNDPNIIAESIKQIIKDPILAESMGKRGRARVEESFNLPKQMQQVFSILSEAACRSKK